MRAAISTVDLRRELLTCRGVACAIVLGAPMHPAAIRATGYREGEDRRSASDPR